MTKALLLILLASCSASAQGSKANWERMLKHDANDDSKISKSEFKGPNVERAFTRFDTNKDGFISKEEVQAAPSGKDATETKTAKGGSKTGGGRPDNAPAAGTKAPNVKAKELGSEAFVDLGAITKTTVLIFGSYT